MFFFVEGRRLAGRADRDDAIGALVDVKLDEALERRPVERGLSLDARLHRGHERNDAAA